MEAALAQAACIVVLGGNTFYLWHHMRQSGLDAIVRRCVDDGALYLGISAGSIVAGRSISTAFWKGWDDPTVVPDCDWSNDRLAALGLVPDRSFFPHHDESWETTVRSRSPSLGHPVVTLREEGGAYVSGAPHAHAAEGAHARAAAAEPRVSTSNVLGDQPPKVANEIDY